MVLTNNRMNEHIALMHTDNKGYQLLQLINIRARILVSLRLVTLSTWWRVC